MPFITYHTGGSRTRNPGIFALLFAPGMEQQSLEKKTAIYLWKQFIRFFKTNQFHLDWWVQCHSLDKWWKYHHHNTKKPNSLGLISWRSITTHLLLQSLSLMLLGPWLKEMGMVCNSSHIRFRLRVLAGSEPLAITVPGDRASEICTFPKHLRHSTVWELPILTCSYQLSSSFERNLSPEFSLVPFGKSRLDHGFFLSSFFSSVNGQLSCFPAHLREIELDDVRPHFSKREEAAVCQGHMKLQDKCDASLYKVRLLKKNSIFKLQQVYCGGVGVVHVDFMPNMKFQNTSWL